MRWAALLVLLVLVTGGLRVGQVCGRRRRLRARARRVVRRTRPGGDAHRPVCAPRSSTAPTAPSTCSRALENVDRHLTARVLEAMNRVEADLAFDRPPASLAADLDRLIVATRAGLARARRAHAGVHLVTRRLAACLLAVAARRGRVRWRRRQGGSDGSRGQVHGAGGRGRELRPRGGPGGPVHRRRAHQRPGVRELRLRRPSLHLRGQGREGRGRRPAPRRRRRSSACPGARRRARARARWPCPARPAKGVYGAQVAFDRAGFWKVHVTARLVGEAKPRTATAAFPVRDKHAIPGAGRSRPAEREPDRALPERAAQGRRLPRRRNRHPRPGAAPDDDRAGARRCTGPRSWCSPRPSTARAGSADRSPTWCRSWHA